METLRKMLPLLIQSTNYAIPIGPYGFTDEALSQTVRINGLVAYAWMTTTISIVCISTYTVLLPVNSCTKVRHSNFLDTNWKEFDLILKA